jgi:hypothetical protein
VDRKRNLHAMERIPPSGKLRQKLREVLQYHERGVHPSGSIRTGTGDSRKESLWRTKLNKVYSN